MGCPKNPKKFLGLIPYEGPHEFELRSATCLVYFTLQYECTVCGARHVRTPVWDEEMIRMGYDLRKIRGQQGDSMCLEMSVEELEACREAPG